MARSLQIPRVLVPRLPGALSALGILLADTVRDYSRTVMLRASDAEILATQLQELETRSIEELQRQGLSGEAERSVERSLDLRYVGQGYELNVPYGANYLDEFHSLHRKRYGYASAETPVEVVNVRVRVTVPTAPVELPKSELIAGDGSQAVRKTRPIYFDGAWRESKVYQREQLRSGDRFAGPALIAEYSSTTVVPPDCIAEVDAFGNLVIEVHVA